MITSVKMLGLCMLWLAAPVDGDMPATTPEYTLAPVDEAAKQTGFLAFRVNLQEAVRNKDAEALLLHIAEDVELGAIGEGSSEFRRFWKLAGDPEESRLWQELHEVLRLGGSFLDENHFAAPYVYTAWPEHIDRFEYGVITGANVYVRSKSIREAPHIAQISHEIVRLFPVTQDELVIDTIGGETYPWRKIGLKDGATGYVWGKFVRSPLEYRAIFEKREGRWLLTHFLNGE